MFRRLAVVSLVLTMVGAVGACSEDPAGEPPSSAESFSVPSSEAAKKELGVEKWFVEPGDPGKWWVAGADSRKNVVVDAVLAIDTSDPLHGSVTYDVHGKVNVHVAFHWNGDDMRSNADDLTDEEQAQAIAIFERMAADLEAAERTVGSEEVITKSVATTLTPQGGHTGGELVRRQQDLIRPGECLLDTNGQYCRWETLKIGIALLKTGGCLRNPLNCVKGPKDLVEAAKKAEERGCKYRPCPK